MSGADIDDVKLNPILFLKDYGLVISVV